MPDIMEEDRRQSLEDSGSGPQPGACGFIDAIESGRVYGWAWNPGDPSRILEVDLYRGDRLIGTETANRFRGDLLDLGIGDGRHAFVFDLPAELRAAPPLEFSACFRGTTLPLARGARVCAPAPADGADGLRTDKEKQSAALRHRVEQTERSLVETMDLLSLLHREAGALRTGVATASRDVEEVKRSLATAERFLLRFDEFMKNQIELGETDAREGRCLRHKDFAFRLIAVFSTVGFVGAMVGLVTMVARLFSG
ncbi:hypothetical protein [Azospirillum sp.]|uniref:hypothetical protein n=1 Tax=Azospirillum sp. TaxID=34012 RepID=UPI002D43E04C|nr:hypothetical protein [Azospirillum sp.]HYD66546.1 hypothetical protein [Azospirillum sp.]